MRKQIHGSVQKYTKELIDNLLKSTDISQYQAVEINGQCNYQAVEINNCTVRCFQQPGTAWSVDFNSLSINCPF